jgi:hypothetical protein
MRITAVNPEEGSRWFKPRIMRSAFVILIVHDIQYFVNLG